MYEKYIQTITFENENTYQYIKSMFLHKKKQIRAFTDKLNLDNKTIMFCCLNEKDYIAINNYFKNNMKKLNAYTNQSWINDWIHTAKTLLNCLQIEKQTTKNESVKQFAQCISIMFDILYRDLQRLDFITFKEHLNMIPMKEINSSPLDKHLKNIINDLCLMFKENYKPKRLPF